MTTIQSVMAGAQMDVLRPVVCGVTNVITYPKGAKQEQLMKVAIRDETAFAALLVFNAKLFETLTQAARVNSTIKLAKYRKSDKPNTLILGRETICSVLTSKTHNFTQEQLEEGRISMYAPLQTLTLAKTSPNKTRISTSGRIVKVFPADARSKRILLKDLHDAENESFVTLWEPHNAVVTEVGNIMTLYDAKTTTFHGGSFDTTSGTSVEIQADQQPRLMSGTLLDFGLEGDVDIAEIMLPGQQDEESFRVGRDICLLLQELHRPVNIQFTMTEGMITSYSLADQPSDNDD